MSQNNNNNWQVQIEQASIAFDRAYAPYSNFHVGAAALTKSGKVVSGGHVENASYGLTVCAERNCIAQAVIGGERELTSLVVFTKEAKLTPPCGACRQVIVEFFEPDAQIMAVNHLDQRKIWTVAELLPDAFTPKDLLDK